VAGAIEKQNGLAARPDADVMIAWDEACRAAALAEARRLRANGLRVSCGLIGPGIEANAASARRCGIGRLIYFGVAGTSELSTEEIS
jgi:hypothetical protein